MRRYLFAAVTLLIAIEPAFAEQPKEVIIVNDTITVEGEVNAVIDEPVSVEGEVTIGNTVGVDVLSLPASGAQATTEVFWSNVQVVAGDPTSATSPPLPIPVNARLLFSNVSAFANENADGCGVFVQLSQAGGLPFTLGGESFQESGGRVHATVQLGRLPLSTGDGLTTTCIKFDDVDDGNCICNSVVFYEVD